MFLNILPSLYKKKCCWNFEGFYKPPTMSDLSSMLFKTKVSELDFPDLLFVFIQVLQLLI